MCESEGCSCTDVQRARLSAYTPNVGYSCCLLTCPSTTPAQPCPLPPLPNPATAHMHSEYTLSWLWSGATSPMTRRQTGEDGRQRLVSHACAFSRARLAAPASNAFASGTPETSAGHAFAFPASLVNAAPWRGASDKSAGRCCTRTRTRTRTRTCTRARARTHTHTHTHDACAHAACCLCKDATSACRLTDTRLHACAPHACASRLALTASTGMRMSALPMHSFTARMPRTRRRRRLTSSTFSGVCYLLAASVIIIMRY